LENFREKMFEKWKKIHRIFFVKLHAYAPMHKENIKSQNHIAQEFSKIWKILEKKCLKNGKKSVEKKFVKLQMHMHQHIHKTSKPHSSGLFKILEMFREKMFEKWKKIRRKEVCKITNAYASMHMENVKTT